MEIIILGSGGINPPPRPGCQCRVCREARDVGIPHARTRPGLFINDQSLLIGASPDLRNQLNRENVDMVENVIIPGWEHLYTAGLHELKNLNYDRVADSPVWEPIRVYIPPPDESAGASFELLHKYQTELGIIDLIELRDCGQFSIGNLNILPVKIENSGLYYFIIFNSEGKIVYIPGRYKQFSAISEAADPDYFIAPCFYWENTTVFKRPIVNSTMLNEYCTFEQMLEEAENLRAKQILITHIEEDYGMSHSDLQALPKAKYDYYPLDIAFDGQRLSI